MMRGILLIAVLGACALTPVRASAQNDDYYAIPMLDLSRDFTALPYYYMLARQALSYQPPGFRFGSFRSRYSMTPQYDPMGKKSRDRLLVLAYRMKEEQDPVKLTEAEVKYAQYLVDHLANIDVVTQALILSEEDSRFGDPEFLLWMREGLLQSVMHSGDGNTLKGAYDIFSLGEETAVLRALNLKVLRTDVRESGGIYYNMHEVTDPETEEVYTVFFDASIPMRHLVREDRERGLALGIRRQ